MRFQRNDAGRFYISLSEEDIEEFKNYLGFFNTDKVEDVVGIDVRKVELEYTMIVKGRDHLFEVPQDVAIITVVNGKIIKNDSQTKTD